MHRADKISNKLKDFAENTGDSIMDKSDLEFKIWGYGHDNSVANWQEAYHNGNNVWQDFYHEGNAKWTEYYLK